MGRGCQMGAANDERTSRFSVSGMGPMHAMELLVCQQPRLEAWDGMGLC